ncbi:MAG: hypothetical protein HQ559_16860 [Lentisphaerae bacterium]|nr:hypothetical protein [Lentisphaerota bacterium]
MWFNDDFQLRQLPARSRKPRRKTVLQVKSRSSAAKKAAARRTGRRVFIGLLVLGATVLAWYGIMLTGRWLFSSNERFALTRLEIRDDTGIARFYITEKNGIGVGKNLFGFHIGRMRDDFLKQRYAAKYRSMDITRRLPGTLQVRLVERVPVVRLDKRGQLVVDREGVVFGLRPDAKTLPYIDDYPSRGLKPGDRITGMAVAALQALEGCEDPAVALPIRSASVDSEEYLTLYFAGGGNVRGVRISWQDMGRRSRKSIENLMMKLRLVKEALVQQSGGRHAMLDATYDDRIFGVR